VRASFLLEIASVIVELRHGEATDQASTKALRSRQRLCGGRPSHWRPRRPGQRPFGETHLLRHGRRADDRGLRERLGTIGLGGRSERGGTIRGGSIILDTEYERRGPLRSLLRTHELGHALGYHHVESRVSIMNPRIGSEPTDVDRRAAAVAFRDRRSVAARPCDEPQG